METLDFIRSASITIGLVACILGGPRTWQLANAIVSVAFGLSEYFLPTLRLEHVFVGVHDKYHHYLTKIIGAQFLCIGVTGFLCRSSSNKAVSTSFMISWVVCGLTYLQCGVLTYISTRGEKQPFSQPFITFAMLTVALMIIGNGYHAFRSVSYAGGTISLQNRVSIHIVIDIFITLAWLVMDCVYPEKTFLSLFPGTKPDVIHIHLVQFNGLLFLCSVVYGLMSLTFPDDKDKRIYLLARLLLHILYLPTFALAQWKYGLLPRSGVYSKLLVVLLTTANIMWGYFHPISLPRFKAD